MARARTTENSPRTVNEIWADDLLGRRAEADMLQAYISSLAKRIVPREDMQAFTLAVDGEYGAGKSFFLRRLSEQLSLSHPVAFIDAWSDDIADEPLTALAATLDKALAPFVANRAVVRSLSRVKAAAGEVAKIAALGLLKRTVQLTVTAGSAELIEQELSKLSDDTRDAAADSLGALAADATDAAVKPAKKLMQDRIAEFDRGKSAVLELKDSLRSIITALEHGDRQAPIVIIIDELDRCRPTYAIKLMEEIKHLFDVEGLVFVLGINLDQLAKAVAGVYGPTFDGAKYLGRFVSRQYVLDEPPLTSLIAHIVKHRGIPTKKLAFPNTDDRHDPTTEELIARYMGAYGLSARDAFQVMQRLETSALLTGDVPLLMPYLLPLVLSQIRHSKRVGLTEPERKDEVVFLNYAWVENRQVAQKTTLRDLAFKIEQRSKQTPRELSASSDFVSEIVAETRASAHQTGQKLADPANYPKLLNAVGRFERSPG